MATKPDNLILWNAVVKTDPAYTKPFSRFGGFKGTAINATYLARKATEQFGPLGIGWGWNIVDEKYVNGAPITEAATEVVHVLRIKLWYIYGDKRGEIEHFGQTTFVGKNKNGLYTDEEAPKKSLTDAISKALSGLGFAADIHLGLYDDNKYVATLKREFGEGAADEPPTEDAPAPTRMSDNAKRERYANDMRKWLAKTTDLAAVRAMWNNEVPSMQELGIIGTPLEKELKAAWTDRGIALAKAQGSPSAP